MKPLNRSTLAPDITMCIMVFCIKIFIIPPTTTTISPVIKKPDMKLKSFFEKITYNVKVAKVIAVKAKASAAIVGPTRYSKGPNVKPEIVVKLKSATIFKPGFRAAKEAKKINAN